MNRGYDRCLSSLTGEIEDLEKRIQELEQDIAEKEILISRLNRDNEEYQSERETTSLKFQELEAANFALTEENQRLKEHLSPK